MTPPSTDMDHAVSCQVLGWAFAVCEEQGIDIDSVMRDIPYSRKHLETPANFIDWPSMVKLVDGVCSQLTHDQIAELTRDSFEHPIFLVYKLIGKLRFDLVQQYLYILGPKSSLAQFYPIRVEVLDLDTHDRRLVIRTTLADGLEPCENLFRVFAGQAVGLSMAMGYPPAEVEATYTERGATYTILLPVEKGFIPSLRNLLTYPFNALRASRMLRRTQDALVQRNLELEQETQQLKEAQKALQFQQRQLSLLNRNIPVVLWSLDLDLNPLYFSPSAEQVFGRPMAELLAIPALELIHPDDRTMLSKVLADEVASPSETNDFFRIRQLRGEDSWFWSEIHVGFMRDEEGELLGVVGISLDIDEKVVTEKEQTILRDQLDDAKQKELIGQMAGGIAHDFNNALQSIIGFSELALRDTDQQLRDKHLTEIVRAARDSSELVKQLLALTRQQPMDRQSVEVEDWLNGLTPMLKSVMGANTYLMMDLTPGLNMFADRHLLERVVMNIVVNARDAMPDGGSFLVSSARSNGGTKDQVCLTFKDSGTGIEEELMAHVFEPFFTTKPRDQGTGLGLSVIAGIIDQHEGRIEISSDPGEGTTVKVYLPSAAPVTSTTPQPDEKSHDLEGRLVMVVDDQPDVRRIAAAFLEQAGCTTITAESGDQALALHSENPAIELILMDVVMPGINGDAAAQRIRDTNPRVAVIFMSGYNPDPGIIESFGDSVYWLSKPFQSSELIDLASQALQSSPANQSS